MGGCSAKGRNSKIRVAREETQKPGGRQTQDSDKRAPADGSDGQPPEPVADVLDLFPQSRVRAMLVGQLPDKEVPQKGWADKPTRSSGNRSVGSFKVGCICKKGLKPESPNQDDFFVFAANGHRILGVFDGHGPYGTDVAGFARDSLPRIILETLGEPEKPAKALAAAFPSAHQRCLEAQTRMRFDCSLSGATGTVAMLRHGKLYVAHVGDCRAVLARRTGNEWVAEELTKDHRPTCEEERRRIQASGGQVHRLDGDIPYRVFLRGKMYPGLAITRSIGDTVGVAAGVTSEPDVAVHSVQADWRFLLLCSDGVWEFLSSQEAVEIAARFAAADPQQAAEALASEAWNRWIEAEADVVDDITVIVSWLKEE